MERLGIPRWRLVAGGSLGGLQALTWATLHPGLLDRAVAVAAAHRPADPGIAHFAAGRALIGGDRGDGHAALLRALAHARRWSGGGATYAGGWEPDWPRERFHPVSYLRLAEAIERYDLARDHGSGRLEAAAARIRAPLDLVAYRGDRLFTPADARALAAAVRRQGGAATVTVMDGPDGHDTFLTQPTTLADALRRALPE
jgi:homoserine O-acetyltransferase